MNPHAGEPEIKVQSSTVNELDLFWKTSLSLAKGVHRSVLSATSSFAFQEVKVLQNSSVVQSGVLQHLTSLLPVIVPESKIDTKNELCSCGPKCFCPACALVFDLAMINDTDEVQLITSNDLILREPVLLPLGQASLGFEPVLPLQTMSFILASSTACNDVEAGATARASGILPSQVASAGEKKAESCIVPMHLGDDGVGSGKDKGQGLASSLPFPRDKIRLYPDITIVKLGKGHAVQLRAIAKQGKSSTHAKFAPYRAVGLSTWEDIVIDEAMEECLTVSERQAIISACPNRVFEAKQVNGCEKLVVNPIQQLLTDDITQATLAAEEAGFAHMISLRPTPWQRLRLDTLGTRLPLAVLLEAVRHLRTKLELALYNLAKI